MLSSKVQLDFNPIRLFKHEKCAEVLDKLGISWVLKSIARPTLYLDKELFNQILAGDITNDLEVSAYFIKQCKMESYISAELFLQHVMRNEKVCNYEVLVNVCRAIKVDNSGNLQKVIEIILDHTKWKTRSIWSLEYMDIANVSLNIEEEFESRTFSSSNVVVQYKGWLSLPNNFKLLRTGSDILTKEMFKILSKETNMILTVRAASISMPRGYNCRERNNLSTFIIESIEPRNRHMNLDPDCDYEDIVSMLVESISSPVNQNFFNDNYCDTGALRIPINEFDIEELIMAI